MKPLKSNLDVTDWAILRELQADARLSYAEIGRRVGLSSPAVQERVRKLEDAHIITGYHAQVKVENLGFPIRAIVRLKTPTGIKEKFTEIVQEIPQILECHHIIGEFGFNLVVVAESMEHLESLLKYLFEYGETETTVILTTPLKRRSISPDAFPDESQLL
ncbi:MAG: Lrp/AsnC family transcriptional regulator [Chloroflexota bacterium]